MTCWRGRFDNRCSPCKFFFDGDCVLVVGKEAIGIGAVVG